jgi:hypothetical protein
MTPEIKKLLQGIVKQYIVHNKIEVKEPEVLNVRFKERGFEYLTTIQEVVKRDTESANFGLKTKSLTQIQKHAFNVSLTHGLTKLAEYIVTGRDTLAEIK